MKTFAFTLKYTGKMVGAGARAKVFDKLEPEPHQKWTSSATLMKSRLWISPEKKA
jgi:hypothetical protein